MTQATIEQGNAYSRLHAPAEALGVVRHHVAFQEAALPPVGVQSCIKGFIKRQGFRKGGVSDLVGILHDPDCRSQMEREDYDPDLLSVGVVENVLRMKGIWDGWRRMVAPDGTFPTGVLKYVERALALRCGLSWRTVDLRGDPPRSVPWTFNVPLYPFQEEAVQAFMQHGRGVIDLPPRSGKTRIAIRIAVELGLTMIYVAPTIGLAKQTARAFKEFLPDGYVMSITGGRQSRKKQVQAMQTPIWIATPKTAVNLPGIKSRQVLIIDEFHHAAAKTWQEVSRACVGCWWRLGLTGTHFRSDGRDMEMAGVLGNCIFRRTVTQMVAAERLTPARIAMLRVRGDNVAGKDWYKDGVVRNDPRNAIVAWAAHHLVHRGKRVLVLAKEIDHTKELARFIPDAVQVDASDNDDVDRQLARLERGEVSCVVGTTVIGEGRDVPGADALVYACGGKSRVKVTQDYFRVLTRSPGKRIGIVVDLADTHGPVLTDHAAQRLLIYREEEAFDARVMEAEDFPAWLGSLDSETA